MLNSTYFPSLQENKQRKECRGGGNNLLGNQGITLQLGPALIAIYVFFLQKHKRDITLEAFIEYIYIMTDTFGRPSNAYASKTIKIFCLLQQIINPTTTFSPYCPSATATTNLGHVCFNSNFHFLFSEIIIKLSSYFYFSEIFVNF